MLKGLLSLMVMTLLTGALPALAGEVVTMHRVNDTGVGDTLGTVALSDSEFGLVLTPDLKGLSPGHHGFHVHQNPACDPAEKNGKAVPGLAAGGNYDPTSSGRHATPWGAGHLGDLPVLSVAADGTATVPVLAPRLSVEQVKGRALMIHAGGDNYSDTPKKLGGGGARVACGVIR